MDYVIADEPSHDFIDEITVGGGGEDDEGVLKARMSEIDVVVERP